VTVATFSRFGSGEPEGTPASFFSSSAAGGVFVIKVKLRSAKTLISIRAPAPRAALGSLAPPVSAA
jgi:hypothetical protein